VQPTSDLRRVRSVLVVAQRFPPADGADARWVAELVRDLPSYGWRATVLTKPTQMGLINNTNPDWAMLAEASRHADVVRVPSPEVLRITPLVDRFVRNTRAWNPGALTIAALLHRTAHFDAIFAVAPPYSSVTVADVLGRMIRRPHLAALRSGWKPTPGSRAARSLERAQPGALSRAARLFDTSDSLSAEELAMSLSAATRGR